MPKKPAIATKTEQRVINELRTYGGYVPAKGTDMHRMLIRLKARGLVREEAGRFYAFENSNEEA